jgi:hypothetical protein
MNIYLNPNATAATIQTAIKNADKAENAGYTVTTGGVFHGVQTWNIFKPGNDSRMADYIVAAHADYASCDCVQCREHGYCKHIELAARYELWLESVEVREMEFDTNEQGRFFMMECIAESLAETAGAWY